MTDVLINDNNVDRRIPISGLPLDVDTYSTVSSSVPSNSILTFTWTTSVGMRYLSLFNFALALRVDTNANTHKWPQGSSLTASQRSLRVSTYQDVLASDDKINKKVYVTHIENYSADSHTIYMWYKTYTFAYITGSSA